MMPGAEIDGAKFDADVAIPSNIKQALIDWKVGIPPTTIDDKVVNVIQGTGANKTRFKLYFEDESGLLVRQVRSPIRRSEWFPSRSITRTIATWPE